MPLTQSKLNFGKATVPRRSARPSAALTTAPNLSHSSISSSETLAPDPSSDAILADAIRTQLPTPAESSVDPMSEASPDLSVKKATRRKSRLSRNQSDSSLKKSVSDRKMESRNVSGETLTNASQSSLLRKGIAALDLPWSVTSLALEADEKAQTVKQCDTPEDSVISSMEAVISAVEALTPSDYTLKREEREKEWQAKKEVEDSKATRRSSRASILTKAGDVVSDLATNVTKRPREALDTGKNRLESIKRTGSMRPRSMAGSLPVGVSSFEGPTTKMRRLSEGDIKQPTSGFAIPRKPVPVRKEKRWLEAGLYVGQTRDFDGRFPESKNQRRHDAAAPVEDTSILRMPMFAGERLLKNGRDYKLPFFIFSPLPPGQPRPDEWRKTNKNVFVGDAAQVWRHNKPQEHSTCMCTVENGCDDNCMNRYMFYECDSANCNLQNCTNRSFYSLGERTKVGGKFRIGVEVLQTKDRGFGVRSNRCFDPNQAIVEYTGEIITQDECDKRMHTIYKDNECYYLMLFDQNMIIDATRGSIARFVNHSCDPNCRMEKWIVGGKPRMALFASKPIMTGDELTYDYNFDPFSQKNVQQCRCGSDNCRGVLGPKPKEERKANAAPEAKSGAKGKLAGAKRKMTEILDEGTDKWNKRTKVAAPRTAVVALKKMTAGSTARKNDRAARESPSKAQSTAKSPKRASTTGLTQRTSVRVSSVAKGGIIDRRASVMKRVMNPTGRRVASSSSATKALLTEEPKQRVSRANSLMAKAASIKHDVVRTVRGAAGKSEGTRRAR